MISFEPLRILMVKRNMSKGEFYALTGIHPRTGSKLWKDGNVNVETIARICATLAVKVEDIMVYKEAA